MKRIVYFCDLCDFAKDYNEIYEIKVKSGSFVNYSNFDTWFPDRQKIHVCKDCIADFKEFINEKVRQRQD